jgi:hypothetical protein
MTPTQCVPGLTLFWGNKYYCHCAVTKKSMAYGDSRHFQKYFSLYIGLLDITFCDKFCQWLATGRWFSLGTPISSTNKTDNHDITEIFLHEIYTDTGEPFCHPSTHIHNCSAFLCVYGHFLHFQDYVMTTSFLPIATSSHGIVMKMLSVICQRLSSPLQLVVTI